MAPLALIANLATRRHHLHQLQIRSPSGTTCIGSKFGHQLAPFALLPKLATRLHHCIATLPWIALLALSVSIELVSSSARVTSVKSYKPLVVCLWRTSGPKDRTPGLPGSDKNSHGRITNGSQSEIQINIKFKESEKMIWSYNFPQFNFNKALKIIIPSQMEVAPLHCTVDIRQKRRLFKNTKEIEKM